jgi:ABC-type sugar transport system substrate-binding protein
MKSFEFYGINFKIRDPNWNTTAQLQAVSSFIAEKPDVLVIQNPNVQLLAREIKRAEEAGIYVIQVNLASNQKSAAFIGADWYDLGRRAAEQMIKDCGTGSGKSGEIELIQGEQTAYSSMETIRGAVETLQKDSAIKVVSNQPANWDATKARDLASAVIQQHPNLCAVFGPWGPMTAGASQALSQAGKRDNVKVYSGGGDGKVDCDNLDSGALDGVLTPDAQREGRAIVDSALLLLQSGQPPTKFKMSILNPITWMWKGNYDHAFCTPIPKLK